MSLTKSLSFLRFALIFLLVVGVRSSNRPLNYDGKPVTGKTDKDDSYTFYTITVGNDAAKDKSLVIKVQEDKGSSQVREDFSDVDIYVSMENEMPKSASQSTWFSERYGDDLITISKKHVTPGNQFHIGVYCQYVCNYKISAYLSELVDIPVGRVNSFLIPKESSMSFKFKAKDDFEQLSFAFISPYLKPFKIYISYHNPSSENTFKVEPAWINGYSLDIYKGGNYYFPGEEYRMVVESQDQDVEVRILISYPETIINLRSSEQIFDATSGDKSKCYSFSISDKFKDETIIINTVLFSGTAVLQFHGYKPNLSMTLGTVPYNSFTYEITTNKVIIITKKELEKLRSSQTGPYDTAHFCIYGFERTSYLLSHHFASQTEALQRQNYLNIGNSVMNYLPGGQVTSYRVLDFSRDANLSFNLDITIGNAKLYAFFSEDLKNLNFNSQRIKTELENKNANFLESIESFSGADLSIPNTSNVCHKKIKPNTNLDDEIKKLSCGLFIIVYCDNEEFGDDSDCIYRLRGTSEKSFQYMSPRTTYYNILSKDDSNSYVITVDDEKIETLQIVENTISGEASMFVYFLKPNEGTYELVGQSHNSYYLPNVVKITKESIKGENVKGTYRIDIKAQTFSTYSVYYYTKTKEKKEPTYKPDIIDIELKLATGEVVQGVFDKDTEYKIYSYEAEGFNPSDIRITLTKKTYRLMFYVFTDLDDFSYNKGIEGREIITGYKWKSSYSNGVVIQKTDPNYENDGTYYIIVYREPKVRGENPDKETYYIGVTDEESPLLLYEGMQHSATLNANYTYQSYLYTHNNLAQPFNLAVNLNYGTIDVYIGFEAFYIEKIQTQKLKAFYVAEDEIESDYITITTEDLKKNCRGFKNCNIYIFIQKKGFSSAQYLLLPKSKVNKPSILNPGTILRNSLNIKESHYYIIEQITPKQDSSNILVKFEEGDGDIYMNLIKDEPSITNDSIDKFPSGKKFDYKGEDAYEGKVLKIPKLTEEECNACRLFITITGSEVSYKNDEVEYAVIYSNDAIQINQNIPLKSEIKKGEPHYFRLYYDESVENIYVSLLSNSGDADLYMKYGEDLPTFTDYDWHSTKPQMDFIALDKNDNFFVTKRIDSLAGYYTILVYGYTDSTYTIFATSHPYRIIPISSNTPGACQCKEANDKCYFRFDNIFTEKEEVKDTSIVFSAYFPYGSGNQYVKLYSETNYDIMEQFPSETDYEYSNLDRNQRNFVKVDLKKSNPKLTKDSMLLVTVHCREKSLVELNSAKITKTPHQYLDTRRENLFYFEKSSEPSLLSFYYQQNKSVNFEVYTYTGEANILVYQNVSSFNSTSQQVEYNYLHIAQFETSPGYDYFNYLNPTVNKVNNIVFFKITPKKNTGLFIKLTYETDWTRVDVGKTVSFQVNGDRFTGYFDVMEEYEDVILSINSEDPEKGAKVFATVNVYDRTGGFNDKVNPFNFRYPNEQIYDYRGSTHSLLGTVSIRIPKNKQIAQGKAVRVLFMIMVGNGRANVSKNINILISPSISGGKRVETDPLMLYYSTESKTGKTRTIFDLKKLRKEDDIFVIEISSCKGNFATSLTDKITYFDEKNAEVSTKKLKKKSGRTVITATNMPNEKYYLSIWGKKGLINKEEECQYGQDCDDVEYLLYYYTASSKTYGKASVDSYLIPNQISKNTVELITGELREKDSDGNYESINEINYKVYISTEESDFKKMASICYLSKMKETSPSIKTNYDSMTKKFTVSGLKTGVKYYINLIIENPRSGELFTFSPAAIQLQYLSGVSFSLVLALIFTILILVGGLFYYYKKYKKTTAILGYEANDITNLGTSEAEMTNVGSIKYTNLTSEAQSI